MQLFSSNLAPVSGLSLPGQARQRPEPSTSQPDTLHTFLPAIDERTLDLFDRANNPDDPIELRNLWLGRVEHELGANQTRPWLAQQWATSRVRRRVNADTVLTSRATVRFVKELFNWFFRDDLYGELRSDSHIILSSGTADERAWGLPEILKDCIRLALERDWYGYSDSRGRLAVREAVAAYENVRIEDSPYGEENVAVTMGGTFATNSIADFILPRVKKTSSPVLCGIPNYPPLVESIARRHHVRLVPLPSFSGQISLDPLIAALESDTPLVFLQTAANPTGAAVPESELRRLFHAASAATMILLDECHEWLGPVHRFSKARASPNVIRISSVSKTWSAPGLKIGWILADRRLIADYYEHASTTFGGPPSFFYTFVEVLTRFERWILAGVDRPGLSELSEFERSYGMELSPLQAAYAGYRAGRIAREESLITLRETAVESLAASSASVVRPYYSINVTACLSDWDDSYLCFRDLLRESGVAVFPGILTFCFSGGIVRLTTARQWADLSAGLSRLRTALEIRMRRQSIMASAPNATSGPQY